MKYFAIVSFTVQDDGWIADYVPKVSAMVAKYGGRYISRSQNHQRLEGDGDDPAIFVVIEWPDKESALGFYNDPAYAPLRQTRLDGTTGDFFLVPQEDAFA